jgi:hypothetical protein
VLKVSDVVSLFHDEKLVQFTLLPEGHIVLTVGGCLHGKAEEYFGQFCNEVVCGQSPDPFTAEDNSPFEENWLLVPTDEQKHALSNILVRAWRHYTAENVNPFFTFGNVQGKGWGNCLGKQTEAQIKSVILLLDLQHKVRVFHDQKAACAATYGGDIMPDQGYVALDIDGRVFLLSPNGYIHRTTLDTGSDCRGD